MQKKTNNMQRISIGAGLLWSYYYLPDALNSVFINNSDIGVEVILRPPLELHDMVGDGRLDLAVGEMPKDRHTGIVYSESALLKTTSLAMIKQICNFGVSENKNSTNVKAI